MNDPSQSPSLRWSFSGTDTQTRFHGYCVACDWSTNMEDAFHNHAHSPEHAVKDREWWKSLPPGTAFA